jgi:hypothetical protein
MDCLESKGDEKMTEFKPLIPGVIHVTGEHDVGKTTFALECGARPSRIAIIDDDGKCWATAEQVARDAEPFGMYVHLKKETKGLPQLKVFDMCAVIIRRLEAHGGLDAIIWDTWSRVASTMKAHVRKNPSKFREPADWAAQGNIKGPQQWKEAQELEAQWIARLNDIAPVVFLITHLKNQYAGSRRTGKQIPDASRTIVRVPRFRIWLRHNPSGSRVPIGLTLKRIDEKRYIDGKGLRTTCILPQRIAPQGDDQSVWDAIRRYIENPVGNRELEPHEIPNEFERSLIEGTMTEDQKRAWMLMLANGAEDDLDVLVKDEVMDAAQFISDMRKDGAEDDYIAKGLHEQGVSYKDIAEAFVSLGDEVSTLQIIQWCK